MKNTYIYIVLTDYGTEHAHLNNAYMYVTVESCKLEMSHHYSFEDGKKEMEKLAKALGQAPSRSVNSYNSNIVSYELSGWID